MEEQKEIWKDIKDFEGIYQVSNMGRVKSVPRKGRKTELILTPTPNTTGYMIIGLRKDGKVKSYLVHRLVLMTFDPIINPEDMEGNHRDFDITNNSLRNLEWTTSQENTDHFIAYGKPQDKTKTTGSNNHLSVLTEQQVVKLREMFSDGWTVWELSLGFEVSESTVRQVVNRYTWKHV